jgi:hypothetical protein
MHLIPTAISILKNDSSFGSPFIQNDVDITFEITVKGYGDFSDFVENGQISANMVAIALIQGNTYISRYMKAEFSDIKKSIESSSIVPYQRCPLCLGTGKTTSDRFTSSVHQTCKVCNGKMVIPMKKIK